MRNKLSKLIDEFMIKNCRKPNVILLGKLEFKELVKEINGDCRQFKEDLKSMGISITIVADESYLKVGYVE